MAAGLFYISRLFIWYAYAAVSVSTLEFDTFEFPSRTCEPIQIEMCKGFGYNYTGGPNFLGHELQKDSEYQLQTFDPLIKCGCSEQLHAFLCATYAPMCDTKVEQLIGPCRPVCENVKARCQPILLKFGFSWPAALNCSMFAERNSLERMCMMFPEEPNPPKVPTTRSPVVRDPQLSRSTIIPCSDRRHPTAYKFINNTSTCIARCNVDNIFTEKQKNFSVIWMAVWATLCFLCSATTVITFITDTAKFKFPERAIIFLSLCYAIASIGYFVRLIAGREDVMCDTDGLMTHGLDNTNCAAIFLLLYYFSMAAAMWWVILSLTWLFSAGLRWSHDAIELYSSYYHLFAWALPAVQSIAIIVLRDVSSEELTGLCFVGSTNPASLIGFVIGPLAAYLLLGTGFLIAGFIVLFCQDRKETLKTDSGVEIVMMRIGIFSVLYTVPATCLIACYFYEYLNFSSWFSQASSNSPSIEIYMLKLFASLMPGLTSGICILRGRMLDTWSTLCRRMFYRKKMLPSKDVTKKLRQYKGNIPPSLPSHKFKAYDYQRHHVVKGTYEGEVLV